MSFRRFTNRIRRDEDLAEKIESHLAHAQDANSARGLSSEEARQRAYVRFGNPHSTRERCGAIVRFLGLKTSGAISASLYEDSVGYPALPSSLFW